MFRKRLCLSWNKINNVGQYLYNIMSSSMIIRSISVFKYHRQWINPCGYRNKYISRPISFKIYQNGTMTRVC